MIFRSLSIALRKWDSAKDRRRVLRCFAEWKALQQGLPAPRPSAANLLIIRLDDIGDYLLFRNHLAAYKKSPRWKQHSITLLGNASWKDLFTNLDKDLVDDTIWVEKNRYLGVAAYRWEIWKQLRARGAGTVIAPSRTRPLLLDDLCMLAAAPPHAIGCVNNHVHAEWNSTSDALYAELFSPREPLAHEFHFNAEFAAWVCGMRSERGRPVIEFRPPLSHGADRYIICFVGANTRSKRWPAKRWIEFIRLYGRQHSGRILLAGAGEADSEMARSIEQRTGAQSIAGTFSLWELLPWVAGARAVITNDTMAAHLGASLNRPTVIIANGVNYTRFTEYRSAGIEGVETVYPEVFIRIRQRLGERSYDYSDAVSADIASIKASTVFERLNELLPHKEIPACHRRSMS